MRAADHRPLSSFQQLMRAWNELAPYNFVHAMRLPQRADLARWQHASANAMRNLDLAVPTVSLETRDIENHLTDELNRPFAATDGPLRFFVIDGPGDGHWFGVVLDHWIADDFSCRALLHLMYSIYQAPTAPTEWPGLKWTSVRPPRPRWLRGWGSFLKTAMMLRRARRIPIGDPLQLTAHTFRVELPVGTLGVVRALAGEQGATVHDVFLAAAAQACDEQQKGKAGDQRDAIGIASAMDLRRFEASEEKTGFGCLLSQYTVVERSPQEVSTPDLVARIAARTRRAKAVSDAGVFAPALLLWQLAGSRRAKATLFHRGAPLAVGLSNVNLTGSWIEQSRITEYRRVGPTGPVVPMLFMITTLHGRIFIDVTYRESAFTRRAAEDLLNAFARRLQTGQITSHYSPAVVHPITQAPQRENRRNR